jgi:hypothetical protein
MGHLHRLTFVTALVFSAFGCVGQPGELADEVSSQEATSATITFARDFTQRASTTLRLGQSARVVYDAARLPGCRAGDQGGIPQWSLTGFARIGDGPVVSFPVAGLNAPASAPSITLDRVGELQVWFQANNRYGCSEYDSNYGRNYRFAVALPANAPSWVGNGNWVVSRATCAAGPCDADRRALTTAFEYGTWARQRAAIRAIYFEVYKAGVTDRDNPDLWRQLDVQVLSRPVGTTQAWRSQYVRIDGRSGNNARYAMLLRELDPIGENTITRREDCPSAPLTVSPDGMYVSAELEYFFRVNGVEYRPGAGQSFRGTFSQYRGLLDLCLAR